MLCRKYHRLERRLFSEMACQSPLFTAPRRLDPRQPSSRAARPVRCAQRFDLQQRAVMGGKKLVAVVLSLDRLALGLGGLRGQSLDFEPPLGGLEGGPVPQPLGKLAHGFSSDFGVIRTSALALGP